MNKVFAPGRRAASSSVAPPIKIITTALSTPNISASSSPDVFYSPSSRFPSPNPTQKAILGSNEADAKVPPRNGSDLGPEDGDSQDQASVTRHSSNSSSRTLHSDSQGAVGSTLVGCDCENENLCTSGPESGICYHSSDPRVQGELRKDTRAIQDENELQTPASAITRNRSGLTQSSPAPISIPVDFYSIPITASTPILSDNYEPSTSSHQHTPHHASQNTIGAWVDRPHSKAEPVRRIGSSSLRRSASSELHEEHHSAHNRPVLVAQSNTLRQAHDYPNHFDLPSTSAFSTSSPSIVSTSTSMTVRPSVRTSLGSLTGTIPKRRSMSFGEVLKERDENRFEWLGEGTGVWVDGESQDSDGTSRKRKFDKIRRLSFGAS